jgi:hypothetical protein
MRLFRSGLKQFATKIEQEAIRRFKRGHWNEHWKEISNENMLLQRTELVARVKTGMLERKDMEVEIGLQAFIVWYLRLDKADRERLQELW